MLGSTIHELAVADPTRGVLLAVVVLLAAILVGLIALLVAVRRPSGPVPAMVLRRRRPIDSTAAASAAHREPLEDSEPSESPMVAPGLAAAAALEVATSGMVCPTCRAEYQGFEYCPQDARRLAPTEEILAGRRGVGGICLACRRAYDLGVRRCPHDGAEVVPAALYWASHGRDRGAATAHGHDAKICPTCRERYDLVSRFCGRDGAELMVIN